MTKLTVYAIVSIEVEVDDSSPLTEGDLIWDASLMLLPSKVTLEDIVQWEPRK